MVAQKKHGEKKPMNTKTPTPKESEGKRESKHDESRIAFHKEFNAIVREVRQKAMPLLSPVQRHQFENAKLKVLGAKLEKRPKMRFTTYLKRRPRVEEEFKKVQEEEKQTGVRFHVGKYADAWAASKAKERKQQRFKKYGKKKA